MPLTIGPVRLATNLLLAPIANYCDLAFRIVCREQGGVGLACTDLLSPHGLLRGTAQSLDLARTNDADKPVGMQLYGAETDIMCEGARWAVDHGATVIDINMGCPVDKVTKKNGGSMLLCRPDSTVKMAEAIVGTVTRATGGRVPVTAKMRLGWDSTCIVAPSLARELEKVGIAAVTVHGRTTEQKFSGSADWSGIARVVEAVERIPVIGNGDVTTPEHVLAIMQQTGCAGVMIGRGALSAPWIFRLGWEAQLQASVSARSAGGAATGDWRAETRGGDSEFALDEPSGLTPPYPRAARHSPFATLEEPSEAQKIAILRRYLDLMVEYRGEHYAMNHIRRRVTWFAKKLPPCKPFKETVREAPDAAAVYRACDEYLAGGLRSRGWESEVAPERARATEPRFAQPIEA
ncbi:MAG: tRNA dihydrouridine synthase [Phycisphaerales bacterium]